MESIMSEEVIYNYGWRIPFFISVLGSAVALYMRKNLIETVDFTIAKQKKLLVGNPIAEMFKNHKLTILGLFSVFLTTQISFFVVFIYGKTMMIDFINFDRNTAGMYILLTVISYTIATVIFGFLADKINKRYIILFGIIGLFSCSIPFINSLQAADENHILIMCLMMGGFIGMTEGTLNPLVAESFPINIRATSVSFCWNFTAVAFGGVAPILTMWLIENAGGVITVAYYLMSACLISMIGLVTLLIRHKTTNYRELNKEIFTLG